MKNLRDLSKRPNVSVLRAEYKSTTTCEWCGTEVPIIDKVCPHCGKYPYKTICPSCCKAFESNEVHKYCPNCGNEFAKKKCTCINCHMENSISSKFCTYCGSKLVK